MSLLEPRRSTDQLQTRQVGQQGCEAGDQLCAREIGTETEMRAEAKGQMRVRTACDVEAIGVIEHCLIAVARRVELADRVTGRDMCTR